MPTRLPRSAPMVRSWRSLLLFLFLFVLPLPALSFLPVVLV